MLWWQLGAAIALPVNALWGGVVLALSTLVGALLQWLLQLPALVKQADIVVGAVGKPEFIKADWIKDGAVVVDAGFHPQKCGDIELAPLVDRVAAYTPVPGGVGPMTINTLIFQTLQSGEKAFG